MNFVINEILHSGVVAVVRGASEETIVPIAKSLSEGGVKAIEITMETPKVLNVIEKLVSEVGDEVLIGAGTVLDPETARAAILAGSKFVFSPTVNVETIKVAKRYGVVSIPGAMTPTEILTAFEHGADLIKVFPADVVGPKFFKSVKGPLPHIPLMATGGISLNNVGDYIKAGAEAVGVGGTLVKTYKTFTEEDSRQLTETAKRFVSEVEKAKG